MPHAPDLSGCALDGRYELHAVVGEGAFGRVYRGWDRRLERSVAIKLIKPWWAEDPEWERSFEREARLLARVTDPGIVQIFDVGHAAEGLYYVSELVEGESLARRLQRGPLASWEACGVAEQLCRALARAHVQGIVHRDVKPANILIGVDGRVKVGDFGVARLAEGSTDGAGATVVGTPRYMAPEQARGQLTTPATDVYSAGIVLYEMLAGRPPFTERTAVELALRHLHDPPGPLPARAPPPLQEIVARALAKSPAKRYRSGQEMADALALAHPGAPGHPAPGRRRPASRRRAHTSSLAPPRASVLTAAPAASPSVSGPRSGASDGGRRPPQSPAGPPPRSGSAPGSGDPTRPAPRLSARRNLNPSARRRSAAALGLAFGLLAAMIVAALVIGATGQVRVPRLGGLTESAVRTRSEHLSLRPSFGWRYSGAVRGTVIAQAPGPGRRLSQGSAIQVVLSAGLPPVTIPQLAGESATSARAALQRLGLRALATPIVAPGVTAGTVTSQLPAPGSQLGRGQGVRLNVAAAPRWRRLTGLAGGADASTIRFRVRGTQWRIVYTMAYQGTCTFILFCSGPQADVSNVDTGATVAGLGLNDGGRQTRVFQSAPGTYSLTVRPGSDTARWSLSVEDYY